MCLYPVLRWGFPFSDVSYLPPNVYTTVYNEQDNLGNTRFFRTIFILYTSLLYYFMDICNYITEYVIDKDYNDPTEDDKEDEGDEE